MKTLIPILMTSAGVIVAISAAAKLPEPGHKFPSTTPISLAAVLVAASGIVVWHRIDRQPTATSRQTTDADRNPVDLIRELQAPLRQLCHDAENLECPEIRRRVDILIDQYVLPFTESRQAVVHKMGIRKGAELLINLAAGERLLNRAWTAAADEHWPEAVESLHQAQLAIASLSLPSSAT